MGLLLGILGALSMIPSIQAEQGIERLKERVDTLIVIPNDRLLTVASEHTSIIDAFRMADDVLREGVSGISGLITTPGLINTDFADVKAIMSSAGTALMGIGRAHGENRSKNAARQAVSSSLLEESIDGARGILLNIAAGPELGLFEVNEAAEVIREVAHAEANIIFGTVIDDSLGEEIRVTVIAAGFDRYGPGRSGGAALGDYAASEESGDVADPFGDLDEDDESFDVPSFLR